MELPGLTTKRMVLAGLGLAMAAGFYWAMQPKPVPVDIGEVTRGPMQVTIDEEGKTRIKDVYTVSAPVAGKVLRIPLEPGDEVVKDKTIVAVVQPTAPPFLDARTRRETQAMIAAANAAVQLAVAERDQAETELKFANQEYSRAVRLARTNTIPRRQVEKARTDRDRQQALVARARANLILRQRELDNAKAKLIGPEQLLRRPQKNGAEAECCVELRAPVSGRLLKRMHESEKVVPAGEPLVEVGDTGRLEVIVELRSKDAVKVKAGNRAIVEGYGDGGRIPAIVRRIEPAAFTKVSALGIEEQRVLMLLDFKGDPGQAAVLGHEFRVFTRTIIWEKPDALRVPLSAIFRHGKDWAVFVAQDGIARRVIVKLGQRNSEVAQVLSGIDAGARVLLHPSDLVDDGVEIEQRKIAGK